MDVRTAGNNAETAKTGASKPAIGPDSYLDGATRDGVQRRRYRRITKVSVIEDCLDRGMTSAEDIAHVAQCDVSLVRRVRGRKYKIIQAAQTADTIAKMDARITALETLVAALCAEREIDPVAVKLRAGSRR